ncbi:hypothetical protein SCP_0107420 [Sparassis crispa]|uniref:Uncharacterized protein n=1 Tax=Sparassis crispa TaxID=139825 RepID=A0A401G6R5_9APHY|nr:hypothetical protein SCP_0107420 [Sparassis crispa]GBE77860.1 hypothetical protein SCP_0107420 [Sparassis crispa]
MSVMNTDLRSQEDHLRLLLDQRAARADLHGRFPSISEMSDSPSVYSHPRFSPRPPDRSQLDPNSPSFHVTVSSHHAVPPSEPRSPISSLSDRERLNFPNASSLDLDDDPRSSYDSTKFPSEDEEPSPEEDEEDMPRLSVYGPKMRVHSRAPWELGEDEIEEQDEVPLHPKPPKPDSGRRGWGLTKGANEKRPSIDSNRSQARGKQSFETVSSFTSNGGALLALAQASMSSTSLALAPSPQSTLRDKLSLPRLRPRTPSNSHPPSVASSDANDHRQPFSTHSGNTSPMSRYMHTASPTGMSPVEHNFSGPSGRAPHVVQYQEYTHPYANPDLVHRMEDNSQRASPRQRTTSATVSRSDSNATVTDTATTSSMFQSGSFSTASLTPVTSASSVNQSVGEASPPTRGTVMGKGISAPVAVGKLPLQSLPLGVLGSQEGGVKPSIRNRDTRILSGVTGNGFLGWSESSVASSIKLITLEEAQAQARERSRSATANPAISSPSSVGPVKSQVQGGEWDQHSLSSRTRTRTTSAGSSKAKNPTADFNQRAPPLPTDSPYQAQLSGGGVPPRTIARKRSGFMRLFNANRERPSQHSPPPPVPSLSTDTLAYPTPVPQSPVPRKSTTHRVPVPSLSPSLLGEASADGGETVSFETRSEPGSRENGAQRERQLSARRKARDLSIVTSPALPSASAKPAFNPMSVASDKLLVVGHLPTSAAQPSSLLSPSAVPSSAPPGATDFVALSLRPVSTLFSNSFADQLISPGNSSCTRPSLDLDLGTPTTATTVISPLSSDFPSKVYPRAADDKTLPVAISSDDQSSVIQALQEQVMTARSAWQRQIWELEGQVHDLKAEVDEMRSHESESRYCSACGRGGTGRSAAEDSGYVEDLKKAGVKVGVVNRPRARTGVGSRFGSAT